VYAPRFAEVLSWLILKKKGDLIETGMFSSLEENAQN
jgi:hypothetical protein